MQFTKVLISLSLSLPLFLAACSPSLVQPDPIRSTGPTSSVPAPSPTTSKLPAQFTEETVVLLEGKKEDDVVQVLESNNVTYRVVAKDGQMFPTTMDYQENRVNLVIDGGVVTKATLG